MMKKAAIIIASGFEEGEALTIADIIKRAHLKWDTSWLWYGYFTRGLWWSRSDEK